MKTIMVTALLFSMNAMAHVSPGDYKGKDQNGNPCSFTVGEAIFDSTLKHPLTERLLVSNVNVAGTAVAIDWKLGHPPVVNTQSGLNRFNHDIFQQILPHSKGAVSLTLLKAPEKEEEEQPPVGIIYVDDVYSSRADSKNITCLL